MNIEETFNRTCTFGMVSGTLFAIIGVLFFPNALLLITFLFLFFLFGVFS